jgi:hypothetical protein
MLCEIFYGLVQLVRLRYLIPISSSDNVTVFFSFFFELQYHLLFVIS